MKGKVYLVGAGPGDYKLLTLKGLECIRKADVIVYDRLANINYLKEAKKGCEFINVGKASSDHLVPQDQINRIIADKALEGKIVTRLKGGDPYVFGRGGEEGELLEEEGEDYEKILVKPTPLNEIDELMVARKLIGKPLNPEQVRKVMVVLSSEENSD